MGRDASDHDLHQPAAPATRHLSSTVHSRLYEESRWTVPVWIHQILQTVPVCHAHCCWRWSRSTARNDGRCRLYNELHSGRKLPTFQSPFVTRHHAVLSAVLHQTDQLQCHGRMRALPRSTIRCAFWVSHGKTVLPVATVTKEILANARETRDSSSSKNRAFWRGYPDLTLPYGELEPIVGRNLRLLIYTLNAENSTRNAGCLGLSPVISAQFTLEMCVAAWNCEKMTKTLFWEFKVVEGHRCWYPRKGNQQWLL